MAKKVVQKKSTTSPSKIKPISKKDKKVIKRQNTMETTAQEGRDFIERIDKVITKKNELGKKESSATANLKIQRKTRSTIGKSSKPDVAVTKSKSVQKKGTKKTSADSASAVPKKSAPAKKAAPTTKIVPVATPAVKIPTTSSLFGSSLFSGSCQNQNDINSCKNIASTEVVDRGNLGKQIVKKSLKGQAPTDQAKQKKQPIPLKTITGERLAAGMIDVVFCCDTTSSMGSQLAQCLSTVKTIMKKILDKTSSEGISVKFGFVAYRDHPPQDSTYLTCSYDLTNQEEIIEFIGSLRAQGGGDTPEAAFDGLYVASKHMSWRDSTHIPSLRYIFHIADAPPHGKEYYSYSGYDCPCGLDINKISHIINQKQIHYRFVGTGTSTDKMVEIFKEKIVDFEECKIEKAADMDIRISDMIIRELLPDMIEEEL